MDRSQLATALILIGLMTLLAMAPVGIAWMRRRRVPVAEYPRGLFQHAAHVLLLCHLALSLTVLAGLNPLSRLPGADLLDNPPSRAGSAVMLLGLCLFALGNYLRVSASISLGSAFEKDVLIRTDHQLITTGLFGFSRHPIYFGNLLAEFGLGLSLLSWPLLAFSLILSAPVWNARAAREEVLLEQRYGGDYAAYRNKVRRWGIF